MSTYGKYEDATLRKVFQVTLDPTQASEPVAYLGQLAKELQDEVGCAGPIPLSSQNLERVIMDRLSNPPAAITQWPVHYLIACYGRAADELRSVSLLNDPADQARLSEALGLARQLAVSYAGLTLLLEMFPQPPPAKQRGALQLLDSLEAAAAASNSMGLAGGYVPGAEGPGSSSSGSNPGTAGGAVPMPAGFLDDFGARFEEEGLTEVAEALGVALSVRLSKVSLLGDFSSPLSQLERLARCKPLARTLTRTQRWLPQAQSGRTIEFNSLLGPAFGISCIPDLSAPMRLRQPDVVTSCFANAEQRSPTDLAHSRAALQASEAQARRWLHTITIAFLQNKDTREAMLNWLAAALSSNAEREKMQPDLRKAATDGFMLNVACVMLQLCEPFIDPLSGKAWPRLDARYVSDPDARDYQSPHDATRLAADSAQVVAWGGKDGSGGSGAPYHFICECFFMAAHALRLGLLKTIDNHKNWGRRIQHFTEMLQDLEQEVNSQPGNYEARRQLDQLRVSLPVYKSAVCCYEVVASDGKLLGEALAFYRLLAAYLLRLASPTAALGGPPTLPLADPAPMEFVQLPEYFVEDLCGLLELVAQVKPDLVEARKMEEFMVFFTVLIGSEKYVKNSYLRGKMVEALRSYMPEGDASSAAPRWRRGRTTASAAEVAMLFEVHPLVIEQMVRSLIQLYVDVQESQRANVFYERFNFRYRIEEILAYLWHLPQHRAAWQNVARTSTKLYVHFINMMIGDSQTLLNESLTALPEVQELERLQADAAAWAALSDQERKEKAAALEHHQQAVAGKLQLATMYIKTMQYTSEDRTVAAPFFEPAVRDRLACILDFFLKYIAVPGERRKLKLKDPEKYHWRPRELITQLASIHLNCYRAHPQQWVEAIVKDEGFYGTHPEMLPEMLSILQSLGLTGAAELLDLERMVAEVEQAKAATVAEEEAFGDVPKDFEDLLMGHLMRDPVRLPSGNVIDRQTAVQWLMDKSEDPFNRMPMTEADLEPLPELAERIRAWVAEQRAAAAAARMQQ